jgi:hypothetical protein
MLIQHYLIQLINEKYLTQINAGFTDLRSLTFDSKFSSYETVPICNICENLRQKKARPVFIMNTFISYHNLT